ncbi:MAG: hypothetical protein AB7K08_13755 [Microbacteriaceae bacterium]
MARRVNTSQLRSQLNRIQSQARQAQSKLNQAVNNYNRAVDNYNREARAHNARVRANRSRLQRALRQLQSQPTVTTRFVTHRTSVQSVQQSFVRLESAAETGTWADHRDLLDLAEGEAAASAETLSALLTEHTDEVTEDEARLRDTTITNELLELGGDLDSRWRGALFALSPRNPDAARHFCTSTRELLTDLVDHCATDAEVLAANPSAPKTDQGSVSRRARIMHRLALRGDTSTELAEFVEVDVDEVITLMKEASDGTHGPVGRLDTFELRVFKARAEGVIKFLHLVLH